MKNSLRKSLIVALTAIVAMLFVIVMALNVNVAKADAITIPNDANAPRVTGEWIDDFYVKDGGSVRRETEGLKFTTVISKAYLQHLEGQGTVEFFATAKKAGGTAQAVTFKYQPTSATMPNDTFNLNTYLNFDEYDGDMDAALATEFIIETYAKITPNEGDPTYVRAYKPEGNDISRSMRAVANMASIEGMAGLEKYFGSRVDIHKGYGAFIADTTIDNKNHIELDAFKGVTITSDTIDLYVGSVKYTCQVADGKIVLPQLEGLDASKYLYVTIFANGKAYTAKVDICSTYKELNSTNRDDIFSLADEYVVFTGNLAFPTIDMDNGFYVSDSNFTGVMDGKDFSMGTIIARNNKGMFNFFSGTIKNTAVEVAPRGGNCGLFVHRLNGESFFKNVFVKNFNVENSNVTNGYIAYEVSSAAKLYLEDVIGYGTEGTSKQGYIAGVNNGEIILTNCDFQGYSGRLIGDEENSSGTINANSTYVIHDTFDELANRVIKNNSSDYWKGLLNWLSSGLSSVSTNPATKQQFLDFVGIADDIINDTVSEELKTEIFNYVTAKGYNLLWQANFTALATATSGNYYIVQDIDLSGVDYVASAGSFTGTLDGLNHAVKNLTVVNGTRYTGLIKVLDEGSVIKNLAIVDVDLSGEDIQGPIGSIRSGRSVTIQDIFITIKNTSLCTAAGGVFGEATSGEIKTTNVFVYHNASSNSYPDRAGVLIGRYCGSGHIYLNNCHFVVKNPALLNSNNDGIVGNNFGGDYFAPTFKASDYHMYNDISEVNVGEDSALTDFMKDCIAEFITQE